MTKPTHEGIKPTHNMTKPTPRQQRRTKPADGEKNILRVCVCLAVSCYLHFWQNDQDLLCATTVTWGWNGHWNKNQHRKLAPENKIPSPLLLGVKPTTSGPWVWYSTTELSTLPMGTSIFSWHFLLTPTYPESNTPPESKHKHKA